MLRMQGGGRHIPVPPEGTQGGMEKDIALAVGLEGRVGRILLDRGGSSRPDTQLEVKAQVERGDKATGWMFPVAEDRDMGDGARLGALLMGLRFYFLYSLGPQRNLDRRMCRK